MKAVTILSMFALACAGTACSEKAPAETETATAASETASSSGQFNLRYPGSETQPAGATAAGQFNLRIPDSAADTGGVRLPDGAVRDNALSGVAEIQTPGMADDKPAEDPEDDIIRLD